MFKLTDFLVEDFVKCQFVSLLQVLLHHTANTASMRGWGWEEENWINSHHRYQITEADTAWTGARRLCFYPPWASACYPGLGLGLSLATCPPSTQPAGGRSAWEAAGELGEKQATLGTGDNENETGENKSISTPHTGLLTPASTVHQRTGARGQASPARVHA